MERVSFAQEITASGPGTLGACLAFEGLDGVALLQSEPDIVEPFHQAALAERIDVELYHSAVRAPDFLIGEVDADGGVGAARGIVDQLVDLFLRQGDGQNAVLETVVVENVGEARRDDAADAEIEQRPGRVLAALAAAEIFAGDQDLGLVVRRGVQDEVSFARAVLVIAQLGE